MAKTIVPIGLMALLLISANAEAGVIVDTLGNDSPGFSDGDIVSAVDLAAAQALSPAPFDPGNAGNGLELDSPTGFDFDQSWTHSYGAIVDTILSATLTIGIHDSEGGSVGVDESNGDIVTLADEQLDFYTVDGTSVKAELITAGFEDGGQGLNGQYEVYTIALPASLFPALADGSATVDLGLKGPVFSPAVLVFLDDLVLDHNGAALVFSTLSITTEDTPPNPGIPEPSTYLVFSGLALCFGCAGWWRKRRKVA